MAENNICPDEIYIPIEDFYEGKSVLITGGTGYLGKVIIEKLLYSCPKIKNVYMLIRGKKGLNATERLQQMLDTPAFSRLKERGTEDLKKIVPIVGDIDMPNLNISLEDKKMLIEEVSVVIHSAATVKFNEPLKIALRINLEGTRNMLELSRMMKKIETFVYVSTAFSNPVPKAIEEIVYPPPAKLDEVYEFVRKFGDDQQITVEFLNGRPNTYTFTKSLAESLVAEYQSHIPVVIVRPAAITASEKEPIEGWVDNWFGPTALVTLVGKGVCRVIYGDASNPINFIPVDYVTNLIIVAAARCKSLREAAVYNSCTSWCNPFALGEMLKTFCRESVKYKFNELPYPRVLFTKRKWIVYLISGLQLLMARVADMFSRGNNSRYHKNLTRANMVRDVLEYFTSHSWVIHCERARALFASLSARDRQVFPFDPVHIDWTQYLPVYFMGIQKYLLKPTEESATIRQSN